MLTGPIIFKLFDIGQYIYLNHFPELFPIMIYYYVLFVAAVINIIIERFTVFSERVTCSRRQVVDLSHEKC